jgi:hypothetical protein
MKHKNKEQGYILLLASLLSAILIAIAYGIYTIALKEMVLATFEKNSELALSAADRGVECATNWDTGYPKNGRRYTAFATSNKYRGAGWATEPGNVVCHDGANPIEISGSWSLSGVNANQATTNFQVDFTNGTCAKVTVVKRPDLVPEQSIITSDGYNLPCINSTNPRTTQRTIEVHIAFTP